MRTVRRVILWKLNDPKDSLHILENVPVDIRTIDLQRKVVEFYEGLKAEEIGLLLPIKGKRVFLGKDKTLKQFLEESSQLKMVKRLRKTLLTVVVLRKKSLEHVPLVRNMFALFEELKFCDCEIVLRGNVTIPCHKIILSRCDTLKKRFQAELKESENGKPSIIEEDEFGPEVVKNLLYFLYGHCENFNIDDPEKFNLIYPMFRLSQKWKCDLIGQEIVRRVEEKILGLERSFNESKRQKKEQHENVTNDQSMENKKEEEEGEEEEEEEEGDDRFEEETEISHLKLLVKLLIESYPEKEKKKKKKEETSEALIYYEVMYLARTYVKDILLDPELSKFLFTKHPNVFFDLSKLQFPEFINSDTFNTIKNVSKNENDDKVPIFRRKDTDRRVEKHIFSLFQSKLFTDIELECLGGKIGVHKVVLVCSSDYFRAMFSSTRFQESTQEVIKIGSDYEVLMSLILYLYRPKSWEKNVIRFMINTRKRTDIDGFLKLYVEVMLEGDKYLIGSEDNDLNRRCFEVIRKRDDLERPELVQFIFEIGDALMVATDNDGKDRFGLVGVLKEFGRRLDCEDIIDIIVKESKEKAILKQNQKEVMPEKDRRESKKNEEEEEEEEIEIKDPNLEEEEEENIDRHDRN